jgi:hypothetical protein
VVGIYTIGQVCAATFKSLNAKQVQLWLGHHSPAFTLAVYVHVLSDELPASPFEPVVGIRGERDRPRPGEKPRRSSQPKPPDPPSACPTWFSTSRSDSNGRPADSKSLGAVSPLFGQAGNPLLRVA